MLSLPWRTQMEQLHETISWFSSRGGVTATVYFIWTQWQFALYVFVVWAAVLVDIVVCFELMGGCLMIFMMSCVLMG